MSQPTLTVNEQQQGLQQTMQQPVDEQQLMQQALQAMQQAQQAVRQAQASNPDQLQRADSLLKQAAAQLTALQAKQGGTVPGTTAPQRQQLEQVYHQIQQAAQTLQLVQSAAGQQQ